MPMPMLLTRTRYGPDTVALIESDDLYIASSSTHRVR
eukprot:COSAG01_NODE_45614_length_407_cov_28.574675_1_plen_36_part_01